MPELQAADFDLSLTGFDTEEIEDLLVHEGRPGGGCRPARAGLGRSQAPAICGFVARTACCAATRRTPRPCRRLIGERKPILLVTDPPYGIELDSEWRDRAGLNGRGPAEPSYMKHRTRGHQETTISGDTRADWSEAFALVPSLQVGYVWHASKFTREV